MDYSGKFNTIITEQTEPVAALFRKADGDIAALTRKADAAKAEIERMKAAKCPKCETPMPADGSFCIACRARQSVGSTPAEAFALGVKAALLSYAKVRECGWLPDDASAFRMLAEAVITGRDNLNIVDAADKAAMVLCASASKGHYMDGPRSRLSFDELYRELFEGAEPVAAVLPEQEQEQETE